MATTAAEGGKAEKPKTAAPTTAEPAPAPASDKPKVTLVYRGSSGRLVDEQSGSEFIRDGKPVTVDAEVWERLKALPFETFTIEAQE